jgi:hypothetical protein
LRLPLAAVLARAIHTCVFRERVPVIAGEPLRLPHAAVLARIAGPIEVPAKWIPEFEQCITADVFAAQPTERF